jgi:hypothetical protein
VNDDCRSRLPLFALWGPLALFWSAVAVHRYERRNDTEWIDALAANGLAYDISSVAIWANLAMIPICLVMAIRTKEPTRAAVLLALFLLEVGTCLYPFTGPSL